MVSAEWGWEWSATHHETVQKEWSQMRFCTARNRRIAGAVVLGALYGVGILFAVGWRCPACGAEVAWRVPGRSARNVTLRATNCEVHVRGNGVAVRYDGVYFDAVVCKAPARLLLQNAYNETLTVTARPQAGGRHWACVSIAIVLLVTLPLLLLWVVCGVVLCMRRSARPKVTPDQEVTLDART